MNSLPKSELTKAKALFLTRSGRFVDLMDLRPEDITISDIANGLANTCRYNGQVKKFYSVAEHCVRLANLADKQVPDKNLAKYLLLHDASEAYVGDIVYHLKQHYPEFIKLENNILDMIFQKFNVKTDSATKAKAHELDRRICVNEMEVLCKELDPNFEKDDIKQLPLYISPWSPYKAKINFLATFRQLFK